MITGVIVGIGLWYLSRNIWLSIILAYLAIGSQKYLTWRRRKPGAALPPIVRKGGVSGFILTSLLWPIIMMNGL